jgi:peptide/nickel transport system substrate-binding protein
MQPDARWGDGVPVTTADVMFSYEGRASNPQERRRRGRALSPHPAHRRPRTPRPSPSILDRLTFDYAALNDFDILPAHIERAAFADPAQYRFRTRYDTDPTNPGPL